MKKDIHNNLIKFGSLHVENLRVLDISGDLVQVENFLKGQVTSDHEKMTEGAYQLSSICNHKGQVIADFIIFSCVAISSLSAGLMHNLIGWDRMVFASIPLVIFILLANCLKSR